MDLLAIVGNVNRLNLAIALPIGVNLPVFWQATEPGPLQAAQQFQILQTGIPAIESHQFRLEATLLSLTQHLPKMVIFAQAISFPVVDAKIARQTRLAIRLSPVQQARVGIVRWTFCPIRMGFGCFGGGEGVLAGNQELDIVEVITFWWIHIFSVTELKLPSTA
jgi:hypothetical protein